MKKVGCMILVLAMSVFFPVSVFAEEAILIPEDFETPVAVVSEAEEQILQEALPASWSSVDAGWVSNTKDQGDYGLCWAFSAVSCAESDALISKRISDPDFSEMHLAYFLYHAGHTSESLCGEDQTCAIDASFLDAGGNSKYTTFSLANWYGMANESRYPYSSAYYNEQLTNSDGINDVMHLRNAEWISMENTELVKQAVMAHGCVGTSYYHADCYYNTDAHSFYNPFNTNTNHAVCIIGWDDHYAKENFRQMPEKDGAWLIKTSYKTEQNNGYLWISYEDKGISNAANTAFVFEYDDVGSYAHNYYYDGSCGTKTIDVDRGCRVANVFTAQAGGGLDEELEAVGIAVGEANVQYQIRIYLDPGEEPDTGTPALQRAQTGTLTCAGFYTIPLEEPVHLRDGQRFSVVVTLNGQDTLPVSYFVDESYTNGGWIGFVSDTSQGESFIFRSDGWIDLDSEGKAARIKAFTNDLNMITPTEMIFPQDELKMKVGEKGGLTPKVVPENAFHYTINWNSSDETVAVVDKNGLVKALKSGECSIYASTRDTSASYKLTVSEPVPAVVELSGQSDQEEKTAYDLSGGKASSGINIKKAKVSGIQNRVYTGKELKQKVKVTLNHKTLRAGTDFTLSYRNNRKVGKATLVITGKGNYTGTVKKSFLIRPEKTEIRSLGKKKKSLLVKWKKQKVQTSGYQIQYATNKNFTSGKKKVTVNGSSKTVGKISGLKSKKKYYIRIRTYKTVAGKRYYSLWSRKKAVITK